ncbi:MULTISPECIES: PspC domain-containing protein [unclassified Companilactobacillus]|jgi:phage shock protein PspC (stress-responsive transcriptional regulator)|uniref:PspC domain-containing protein n=1 Tax=unclassified Companilactobacillus TaxID=2767904 RepID=UPI002FEF8226
MHIPIKRSNSDKVFAGVIGGLAQHFQWNPTIARVLWVILSLTPVPGIIVYLILWMLMENPD